MSPAAATPPTSIEVDRLVFDLAHLRSNAKLAQERVEEAEKELIDLVKKFGAIPEGASQSRRLLGNHSQATVTFGMTRSLVEKRIIEFREYMRSNSLVYLFKKMFEESTRFTLVDGAQDVLAGISHLPPKTREKAILMFGACVDVKNKKPILATKEIETRPVRKPRAGKAAA